MYSGDSLRQPIPAWCYCISLYQSWMLPNLGNLSVASLESLLLRFRRTFGRRFSSDEICKTLSLPQETIGLFIQVIARATEGAPVYYHGLYVPSTDRRLYISDGRS